MVQGRDMDLLAAMIAAADWHQERHRRFEDKSSDPFGNSPQRLRCQLAATGKDRWTWDRPVDALRCGTGRLVGHPFAVRCRRPVDRQPVASRYEEESPPARGCSIVRCVEHTVVDGVPKALELRTPGAERLTHAALVRPPVLAERAPAAELLHVLQEDHARPHLARPVDHYPGKRADSLLAGHVSFRYREVRAVWRCPQEIHWRSAGCLARFHLPDIGFEMSRLRMVGAMDCHRHGVVVYREVHSPPEGCLDSDGGSASSGEKVDDETASFCGAHALSSRAAQRSSEARSTKRIWMLTPALWSTSNCPGWSGRASSRW